MYRFQKVTLKNYRVMIKMTRKSVLELTKNVLRVMVAMDVVVKTVTKCMKIMTVEVLVKI